MNIKNTLIGFELIIIFILFFLLIPIDTKDDAKKVGYEIEKKWLIRTSDIPYDLSKADKYEVIQNYINFSPEIRIRKINGSQHVMTVKYDTKIKGLMREEREYVITEEEYNDLLEKKEGNTIYKTRYQFADETNTRMQVDVFSGDLEGLAYLEIEFPDVESAQSYKSPSWVIKDVTTDLEYKNGFLARYGMPESFYNYIK